MTMSLKTDRHLIRSTGSSRRYVEVTVSAPEAPRMNERAPLNLSIVLDRSGSMAGEKIRLAVEAAQRAVRSLAPTDRFSIVVFDTDVDLVVPSTPATPGAIRDAERSLACVHAGSSTNLFGGWMRGCEQVALHLAEGQVGRVLLLTDGLANHGPRDAETLATHAAELRARGIATTTFGLGRDFDEVLLQRMAQAGGGYFYFIERALQIPDYIAREVGEALEVVARSAALVVSTPSGVRVSNLSSYPAVPAPGSVRFELGSLVSRQRLTTLLEITFPDGGLADRVEVGFRLTDADEALDSAPQVQTFTFATHEENDRQPRDRAVDVQVATIYAARARQRALELNREGIFREAQRILKATAAKIRSYAFGDIELERIANELECEVVMHHGRMEEFARKRAFSRERAVLECRDMDGSSLRW